MPTKFIMRSKDRAALKRAYKMAEDFSSSKKMIKYALEKEGYTIPSYDKIAENKDEFYYALVTGMACFFKGTNFRDVVFYAAKLHREPIVALIAAVMAKTFYRYSDMLIPYYNNSFKENDIELTYNDMKEFRDFILYKKEGE